MRQSPHRSLIDGLTSLLEAHPMDGAVSSDVRLRLCGNLEEARLLALEDRADALLRLAAAKRRFERADQPAGGASDAERMAASSSSRLPVGSG
ncbi:hypothetical protein, partial [Fodinicola feengrottensis]|uniref:hypothetical protein n=1 Tax=Fodinicola feengrottensis TaxID=435914 RepID=UPI0013D676C5